MPFKAPKGDIRWWSYLWFLAGIVLLIYGPVNHDWVLAIFGVIALLIVALIWTDQKWIAPILIASYGIAAVLRLLTLILKGFTLGGLGKVIMPIYFAYLMWEWYRSEDPETDQLSLYTPGASRQNKTDPFSNSASSFDASANTDHSSNPYLENRPDER